MSIISGNNITYTATNFVGSDGQIIERTGLTLNSIDFTPTGTDVAAQFGGAVGIGSTFEIFILNSSNDYTISLSSNINFTMKPGPYDLIQPQTVKRYTIIVTSATECDIYNLDYNGTPVVTTNIVQNVVNAGSVVNRELIVQDPGAGTQTINISAPTPLTGYSLVLPPNNGNVNQVLSTDGTGILTWVNSNLSGPVSSTDNAIARFDGTSGNVIQNSGIIIDDTDNITGVSSLSISGSTSGELTLDVPATVTPYTLTLPSAVGTLGQVLTTDASGNTSWSTPSSSGITSINGLTTSSQTLVTGTTGTNFNIDSSGSVHTFNIPISSSSNTGKLSNTDWTTFNSKLTSSLLSTRIFVGNGSNIATAVAMSGNATLSNTGVLTIANNAITTARILNANVTNAKLANSTIGLSTGSTGTDVNVSGSPASLGAALTLNIPIASSSNTGKLSNTDWTTFNSKLTGTLTNTNIFVGNGSNIATSVAMSGDATIANTGALTIANDAITTVKILNANVTNAKLANSSLTVTAGDGLQNGGSVSLGASVTIDVDSTVVRTSGAQSISGVKTFNSNVVLSGTSDLLLTGSTSGALTLDVPATVTPYTLTLPSAVGTLGQVLTTDASGITSWSTPSSGGITSINGLTTSSQTLVTGTTGTNFNIDSSGSVHTFNIPIASSSNTGKLSNTDWTIFNSKLTGTLTNTNIFVGNGSNIATSVAMSGDATIANTGALTIANNAITTSKILNANVTNAKLANSTIGLSTGSTGTDVNVSGSPASLGASLTLNIPIASSSNTGKLSNTDWTTFNSKLTSSLLNTRIFVGNGSNVATAVAMSGDATIANTGALTLANSGVTAASYGASTTIGTFTVDSKGRITTAANVSIPIAGASTTGLVNSSSQTFGGAKTFNGNVIIAGTSDLVLNGSTSGALTLDVPATVTNYTLILPSAVGSLGQVLTTNASGVTSWASPTVGDVVGPVSSTDNAIVRWNGTTGKLVQNGVVTISDTGAATGFTTINASSTITATGAIRSNTSFILQDPNTPTNLVTISASTGTTSSYGLTLPIDDGAVGQSLITNGSGILSWNNISLYDIVIDPGTGTLETAISGGAISIYMRSGVYNETTLTNLPNNILLVGENKSNTVINFGGTATSLTLQPTTVGLITGGTVSVASSSTTVTGSGTTFTSLNPVGTNTFILLGDSYHLVLSVTNNTTIVLAKAYEGNDITGQTTSAGQFVSGTFKNFMVTNSSGNLLNATQAINMTVENICFINSATIGLNILNSTQILVSSNVFSNLGTDGIRLTGSTQCNISHSILKNNIVNGINFISGNTNIVLDSLNITGTGGTAANNAGIQVAGSITNNYINITDCIINYNDGLGINTDIGSGYVMVQSCTLSENGSHGIDFDGTYNTIGGCTITNNGGYGIQGGADGSLISNVIVGNTLNGINVAGDNNLTITGCQIQDNLDNGIGGVTGNNVIISACLIQGNTNLGVEVSTGNNVNITGCQINGNGGGGVLFGGISNVFSANQVENNGGNGINITGTGNIVTSNYINGNGGSDIINGGTGTTIIGNQSSTVVRANNIPGSTTVGGFIEMSTNKITGLGDPTAAQDAVTLNYLNNYSNILYAYDSVGGQDFATSPTIRSLTLGTVSINNSSYGVTQVNGGAGVNNDYTYFTFPNAGYYEISYWLQASPSGGAARASAIGELQTDTVGGTTFTFVNGSRSACYLRSSNTTWSGCGKTIFLNVTNTITKIRVAFYTDAGTNTTTVINCGSITLRYLKP